MFITTKELQKILSCCRSTAEKVGIAAGAKINIGRAVRWDWEKIRKYLEKG